MGDKKYKGIAPITGPMPLHFPAVTSGHQYSNRRISVNVKSCAYP